MNKKLYLCGLSETDFKKKIPFNDPNCETWGLGVHAIYMLETQQELNFNKLFEIHDLSEYSQDTLPYLKTYTKKVVLKRPNKQIKNYELFPFKEIYKTYGKYFTNSLSYMLMLGYHLGYREIYLYGISFSDPDRCTLRENIQERSNFYYWLGYCQGRGCKITNLDELDKYFLKTKNVYSTIVLDKIASQRKIVNKEFQRLKKKRIKFSEYSNECQNFLIELFKLGNE
jgi:hypothetical protein